WGVVPWQRQALVECAAFDVLACGADHDRQVLAHVGIALDLQLLLKLRLGHRGAVTRWIVRTEVGDLLVVAGYAEEAGRFRREPRLRLEQDLCITVAGLHPRWCRTDRRGARGGSGGRRCGSGKDGQRRNQRQGDREGEPRGGTRRWSTWHWSKRFHRRFSLESRHHRTFARTGPCSTSHAH